MRQRRQIQEDDYEDIIHLPHHQSTTRPHMSIHDRAAQFAPFAALTGHKAVIQETARLTSTFQELNEDEKIRLDRKLQQIRLCQRQHPSITVTWFRPDEHKKGGTYLTKAGSVKKIDEYEKVLIFSNGLRIPIHSIYEINGDIFEE